MKSVENFYDDNVAVIGNTTYDDTIYVDTFTTVGGRYTPRGSFETIGGPASTAAACLAKFGQRVAFYGQVGNDIPGRIAYDCMKKEGINLENFNIQEGFNTPKTRITVDGTGERIMHTIRDKSDYEEASIKKSLIIPENFKAILTDGKYYKETLDLFMANSSAIKVIDAGRANNQNQERLCDYVDFIVCSKEFANFIANKNCDESSKVTIDMNDETTYKKVFARLQERYPRATVVITVGEHGCIYPNESHEATLLPAFREVETIDTVAAGDIFHGAFTNALVNDYSLKEALIFSSITAALSTTIHGARTSVPDIDTVLNIFNNHPYSTELRGMDYSPNACIALGTYKNGTNS